jgi:hypothetical protein
MIRVERSPEFWLWVLADIGGEVGGLSAENLMPLLNLPTMTPLAAEHGGFLVCAMDGCGAHREFHTAFRREGWGREAHDAAKEAVRLQFAEGVLMLSTFETLDNKRSRPPLSFGFERHGEIDAPIGRVAFWTLTRDRWNASPAGRRATCPQFH